MLYYFERIHIEYYIDVMKHTESFQRAFEMRCFFSVGSFLDATLDNTQSDCNHSVTYSHTEMFKLIFSVYLWSNHL